MTATGDVPVRGRLCHQSHQEEWLLEIRPYDDDKWPIIIATGASALAGQRMQPDVIYVRIRAGAGRYEGKIEGFHIRPDDTRGQKRLTAPFWGNAPEWAQEIIEQQLQALNLVSKITGENARCQPEVTGEAAKVAALLQTDKAAEEAVAFLAQPLVERCMEWITQEGLCAGQPDGPLGKMRDDAEGRRVIAAWYAGYKSGQQVMRRSLP